MKKASTPIHLRLPAPILKAIDKMVSSHVKYDGNRTAAIRELLVEALDARNLL